MMWKISTAQIREEIYNLLTSRGLSPDEQKGCRKGSRGTAILLFIYQQFLNESRTRRKNLAMAWIDYKKAYDMVPQSWIINHEKLTAGGKTGILQGDAVSPPTIHNCHDATKPRTQKMPGWIQIYKIASKDKSPNVHG